MLNLMHRLAGGRLLAAIAAFALSIGGLFAFRGLPVDAFPDPSPSLVQVFTETEGLSPEEVERYVTFPVESAMSGLPKLKQVRSVSNFGLSIVNVYFEDGTDVYFARQVVGERLAEAAEAIRKILVDSARRKRRVKHGGNRQRVDLADADLEITAPSIDVIALDEALEMLARGEMIRKRNWSSSGTLPA